MLPSLYNGISGLQVHSRALTVNADNIANINTVGFKNSRVSFANVYNRAIGGSAMEFGQGVDIIGVTSQWNSGSFQTTGNALDLAIGGRGMFTLADPNATTTDDPPAVDVSERFYSRDGQFKFNSEGYLVAMNGMRVLNTAGQPIYLGEFYPFSGNPADPNIIATSFDRNGELQVTFADGSTQDGKPGAQHFIGLTDFADYTGLSKEGRNLYSVGNAGFAATPPNTIDAPGERSNGLLAPGSLEMSNTDLATEFASMIAMQRGFQANSKTITTADAVLEVMMTIKR